MLAIADELVEHIGNQRLGREVNRLEGPNTQAGGTEQSNAIMVVVSYRSLGMIQLDAPRQTSLSQEAKLGDDQLVDLRGITQRSSLLANKFLLLRLFFFVT